VWSYFDSEAFEHEVADVNITCDKKGPVHVDHHFDHKKEERQNKLID